MLAYCMPEADAARAQWVVDGCSGPLFSVRRWVPSGFDAYVQICPPAWKVPEADSDAERAADFLAGRQRPQGRLIPTRWAEAAEIRGVHIDGYTHWGSLKLHWQKADAGPGFIYPPMEETPTRAMISAVADAVLAEGDGQETCLVAIWGGFGTDFVDTLHKQRCARIVGMGQQRHFILSAPLQAVMEAWVEVLPDDPSEYEDVAHQSPQAIWPASGAWFYAVPFDWNSSFFASSDTMAQRLLTNPNIEAYPLSHDADYFSRADEAAARAQTLPTAEAMTASAQAVFDDFKAYLDAIGVRLSGTRAADASTVTVWWEATPTWIRICLSKAEDWRGKMDTAASERRRRITDGSSTGARIVTAHQDPGDWGHWLCNALGPGVLLIELGEVSETFEGVAADYRQNVFDVTSHFLDVYKRIILFRRDGSGYVFCPLMSL